MGDKKQLKQKRCRQCKELFTPWNSLHVCCTPSCAIDYTQEKREQQLRRDIERAEKVDRKERRERKQALKSRSDWLREAQTVFNRYIRLRDEKQGCISCDENIVEQARGGNYDAGHYRSRGSAPELRFCEDNCFKQCKKCNRQLSGNVVEMRKGILKRIGEDRLAIVEGHHEPKKYTIDDIKQIKQTYQKKIKEIQS